MTLLEMILAMALLTASPDTLELPDAVAMHPFVAPAVKALALDWELLDPRETDYLKNAQDFASDLKSLQGRFEEYRNAPRVAEVERFPGRDLAGDMLAFNRSYRDSVNNRLDLDMVHADELRTIIAETDLLYRIYDALRDARCEYFYVHYRRQALAQLRDLIGMEAYYSGQLPPHVPLWRIPEAR
jgi:hypothetical protein